MILNLRKKIFKQLITLLGVTFLFVLSSCAGGGYRDIKPTYSVNNSPIPVPYPRSKPQEFGGTSGNAAPSGMARQGAVSQVVIKRGDTVYGIAKREGVEMRSLISVNNLTPPYKLTPGKQLKLPSALFHTVKRGDSGYSISRQYGYDLTTLIKMNALKAPYTLLIGQQLKLPGNSKAINASLSPQARPQNNPAPIVRKQTQVQTPFPPRPGPRGGSLAMPPRESSKFLWPVTGGVVSSYGPKVGGLHNDGINITARSGEGVKSAEAGIVAYSGNGIRGFGNLILVRHSGGWVTAYAHNEELLVSKGDKVSRGQSIAKAGQTGNVDKPQVHFEIRKGKEAVNPVQYLARART